MQTGKKKVKSSEIVTLMAPVKENGKMTLIVSEVTTSNQTAENNSASSLALKIMHRKTAQKIKMWSNRSAQYAGADLNTAGV